MFNLDNFNIEKPVWMVELSNGLTFYQDDGREGCEPSVAWRRLKIYCKENNINIACLKLKYRTNIVDSLPTNCCGYFFSFKSIISLDGRLSSDYYVIGAIMQQDSSLIVQNYKIPELLLTHYEIRHVKNVPEDCIIWNHKI